ncbi:phospholipase D-like domain-containing protein [Rhizorhapis suberifaciens]|uniref:Phospholipase D n=1 Tax=Rhizorhapis suberifaciens TaxID=13656 RepID=A0A840HS15_9SPHN|nr:cardiolipin synthase B [Rhizorhapis suberifaciens]MBB4640324.1 cardiolipin synthase [Rhizorhapis suberifaciens]
MSADIAPTPSHVSARIEGNRLHLIDTGPERLSELLHLIGGAKRYLKLYFYMFESDDYGHWVMERLLDALHRGIAITLMIDSFGSSGADPKFFIPFKEAGGRFGIFGNRRSIRYLIRNHQKIAIADGQRMLTGGFNISKHYFGTPEDNAWRDLGLYLEGPQVAEAERWFDALEKWVMAPKQRYSALRRLIRFWPKKEGTFTWLVGGPVRLSSWTQAIKHDLERGRRCDMVQAYFAPSRGMLRRLNAIGLRGEVRLITASKSDNTTTVAAARWLYGGLIRHGVKIYEFLPCKLHMKLIVIDDIVYIGSANFDMRSLFINLELMLRIRDEGLAQQVRAFIDRDVEDCQEITQDLHRRRTGPFTRLLGWISYAMVSAVDFTVTRRLNFPAHMRATDDD